MDLVNILEQAISELPDGEYSTGLNAIVRHVKSAIRHYERDKSADPDAFTDAIYRTNQAYEGSLKEAYRVLAGKDPAKKSPFDIENYLDENGTVRPRVLTQFTRYRTDYRNPSAHDYKLDFDRDEALLAILSVCGFANLLVHQIRSKLNSNAAQKRISESFDSADLDGLKSSNFPEAVARICLSYTQESAGVDWFEYERGVAESLNKYGIKSELFFLETNDDVTNAGLLWDVTATNGSITVGIESRMASSDRSSDDNIILNNRLRNRDRGNVDAVVVLIRSAKPKSYILYKVGDMSRDAYVIVPEDEKAQIESMQNELSDLKRLPDGKN